MPDRMAYGSSPLKADPPARRLGPAIPDGSASYLTVYLTVNAVAHLLKITTTTVTRMAKSDPTMPVLKLGRRTLRFPKDRLMTWLRDREQGRPRAKRLTLSTAKPLSDNGVASG